MPLSNLTNFRNDYLAEVGARLTTATITTATDTDLLLQSALLKAYDAVNQFDPLGPGALSILSIMTGAELETWLQDPSNRQAFESIAASSTAMTAVAASSTAMTAVAASSTAMTAVAASSTAMTAVAASNTGSDAVFTNTVSRLAIYNSDIALAAFQANPTQVARQIGIGGRTASASTGSSTLVFVPNGTKVILLRRYYGSAEHDMINWARGSTTAAVGQGPSGGGRNLDSGGQAVGTVAGSYTSNGIMPITNDATANFVSAANGLQRRSWNSGNALYITYITV